MKSFKQILSEAKKKRESGENLEGGDMSRPYRTPADIRAIMNQHSGDDTQEWANRYTVDDQGAAHGAESIDSKEDITPARQAEIERSKSILASIKKSKINPEPPAPTNSRRANLYSDAEIADILNARGVRSRDGTLLNRQVVALSGNKALEKVRNALMDLNK